jgi:glycoprotein-N-acetylgalactosamine 3-beta-galactosyltransferase
LNHKRISYFEFRTWAKRCDRSIFIIAGPRPSHPLNPSIYPFSIAYIGDEKLEKYNQLPQKVLLSLLYIYKRYGRDYDWFFKGDDDTYVIVENLRHFLRRRPSNTSLYYGYIAKSRNRFYPSGGAGYVLSQQALLEFGEKILIKPEKRKLCNKDQAEDINLAFCLASIGIYALNARDNEHLETFHPMTFEQHFLGNFTRWIEQHAQFKQKKGEECCSPLTISFHNLSPEEMRMIHFLLYHIQKAPI